LSERATSTLTFLFTDIEGSTRLLQALGDDYAALLAEHDAIIRAVVAAHGGRAFGSEGDAQHAVFTDAASAVRAAVEAQRRLAGHPWGSGREVRVRMGIHTGEVKAAADDFVGLALHETARIAAAGHGGQVLLTAATRELLPDAALPEGASLVDLDEHRFKDLARPMRIFEVAIDGLQVEFPPLRSLEVVGARLPAQVTSFVGRSEVEGVVSLFGTARLVTLTGPGGTGKTRLSIEVAQALAPRFRDGTFFVALDAVTDAELVASEVAATVGLAGSGAGPPIERLLAYLRDRSVMLVLDNMEQVIEAGTGVARIIRECPAVSVLATSRIPLRVYGEQEFPVPALGVPPEGGRLGASEALGYEAVRLFVERAMAARPDFTLTDGNAATVGDIVRRLDGLPLAVELAAARLRTLPLEMLRERLSQRLALLTGGPRDLPSRQRTLRGAIAWSHDLLDVPERRLFARFSVIAGGAALPQAEPICGPPEDLGRDVLDGLQSLTEQSLLRVGDDDERDPRFAMLATIREYALERLGESPEAEAIRRRHAEAYLALAEEAAPHLLGPAGLRWNDRLEHEHDNLRAALDWIVGADEGELGLRMISSLWRFWQVRGHLDEAAERIAAVLGMASAASQPPALRARAEGAAGGVAYWRSQPAATHRHYAAALALGRQADDRALLAEALYNAAFAPLPSFDSQRERYLAGRPFSEESLALYRELGDRAGEASALWALAGAVAAAGDLSGYLELAGQSLELGRQLGDPYRTGWGAHMVGLAHLGADRLDEAAEAFRESLEIWASARDRSGIVLLLGNVSTLAQRGGRDEASWRLAGAAERLRVETGSDIATEEAEFLGWMPPSVDPRTDEERGWFEAGRALSDDAAVELAFEVLEARAS
jgi:predicted ATPase/class 3 adenylate cyclase